jgi:fibronectin-binding autotransporter adhesin
MKFLWPSIRPPTIGAAFVAISLIASTHQALAQSTVTWNTGNSSVAGNWSTGTFPSVDDTVVSGNANLTLNSALNVKSWTWANSGNLGFTIANGGSLTLDGGVGVYAGGATARSLTVSQTDSIATLISASSFGSRGLTVVSATSTETAYFVIQPGLTYNPAQGVTPNGSVNIANAANRNGVLSVSGSLTGFNTVTLGAATGSGTAKFVIDGGVVSGGISILAAAGGTSSIVFKSGTLSRPNTASLQIYSANASPLSIALGSTGSRVVDAGGLVTVMPTARFVDETTGGSLTKTGTNTLVLQGENTYTGDTVITSGTLRIENVAQQVLSGTVGGTGNKVISGLASTAGLFIGQAVTGSGITANSYITALTGTSVTVSGSGTPGAVSATFTAANGTLQGSTLNYSNQGGVLSFGQSTALTIGGIKGSQNLALTNASNAAVALTLGGNGQSTDYSGVLSGGGSLTKTGIGALTLGGANTFSGLLTVGEGSLSISTINNASTNGPLGNSTNAVVLGSSGSVGTLSYTGANASSNKPFTAATGGTAAFSVTDSTATLTLSAAIGGSGDVTFGGPGSYVLSGGLSGGGNVFKTGTGTLTLSVGNSQANTTVSGGQLNVNHLAALGTPAGTLSMAAGTRLDNTSGAPVTITNPKSISLGSSLTFLGSNDLDLGTGNVTLSGNTEFNITANELTLSGDVLGTGYGITKTGTGTLRLDGLSGSHSFNGNSFVNAGTLLIEGGAVLGGGTNTVVTVADGAFLQIGASAGLGNVTVVSRPGGLVTATVVNANQTFDQSGTLTTSNANFNGVQTIQSGVTITTGHNYLGTIPATSTAGRIVFQDNAAIRVTAGFELDAKQGISLASGTAIFNADANQALLIPSSVAGSGGIRKIGAGNVRLTGSNTYSGGTVIEEGIVGISYGESLGDTNGRLTLDGGTIVAAQVLSGGTISSVTIDSARPFVLTNGKTSGMDAQTGLTLRYDGAITEENSSSAAAGLRIGSGSPRQGMVILGGVNTYRGDTTISYGSLKLASGGSFATSARIIVGDAGSSGVVLDLTEKSSFSIGASQTLMGGGTVTLGSNTVLTVSGTFSPGNSPGLFTYSSGTTLLDGTTLMEIWGTSRATSASHGDGFYDAVNVMNGGLLDFNDSILTLSFDSLFSEGGSFDLFKTFDTASFAGNFGSVNVIGSYYTGLTWTQMGSTWESSPAINGETLSFNAASGTLSVVIVVPEPGAAAIAGIGITLAVWSLGKRRRHIGSHS